MKKVYALILMVMLCLSVCGCDFVSVENIENTTKVVPKETQSFVEPEVTEETVQVIAVGDKIVTKNMEIAINSVELTYDVLPDDISSFYTHYAAESGKVYIAVDADVKNLAKQNLNCDKIGKVMADYNDGYTYKGFVIVDDSIIGFTYANITDIAPLETKGIKWLIECPQEIDETAHPLFLEFTIDGDQFIYNIR